jgi:hypothetical protein
MVTKKIDLVKLLLEMEVTKTQHILHWQQKECLEFSRLQSEIDLYQQKRLSDQELLFQGTDSDQASRM